MTPRISVITASHNRCELLLRKLESLKQQTLSADLFEWIVCLNGSSDGSLEALDKTTSFRLTVIPLAENRGPAAGRNRAAKEASSDILYLSDDDCILTPTLLEQHIDRQTDMPGVVIGAIHFKAAEESVWRPSKVAYWNLNGANCSLPKAAFETVGGFDKDLSSYGGEDLLLGYQLKQSGLPFIAAPSALTHHIGPNPMSGQDSDKAFSAGRNAALIAKKHPQLAYRLGVHPGLMLLKHLAFATPLARLWQRIHLNSFKYEAAYYNGAKTVK